MVLGRHAPDIATSPATQFRPPDRQLSLLIGSNTCLRSGGSTLHRFNQENPAQEASQLKNLKKFRVMSIPPL
jgi:hypothetical protein